MHYKLLSICIYKKSHPLLFSNIQPFSLKCWSEQCYMHQANIILKTTLMRSHVQTAVNVQCDNKVTETEIHNAKPLLPTGEVSTEFCGKTGRNDD